MPQGRAHRRRLQATTVATVALVAVFTLATGWLFLSLREAEQSLRRAQISEPRVLTEYEQVIGFGGLIHHFKNWVLRPAEPQLREQALAASELARDLLQQVEETARELDATISTVEQRRMIDGYFQRIEHVTGLHRSGASARAIDRAVRHDDRPAVAELAAIRITLGAAAEAKLREVQTQLNLLMLFGGMVPLALIGIGLLVRRRILLGAQASERQTRKMEDFTRIAAHDLRGPLRQIGALAEFAEEDLRDATVTRAEVGGMLGDIRGRVTKLDGLIRSIFDYLHSGTGTEAFEEVDLAATLHEIAKLYLPPEGELFLDGPMPAIRARRVELETVLRNLISNAVKHHPTKQPVIKVRHRTDGEIHAFEVEDDGTGIPPEHRSRIFEMFRTLSAAEDGEVTGLGLAQVRRIVDNWRGEITVRDATPHGAVFAFSMPAT